MTNAQSSLASQESERNDNPRDAIVAAPSQSILAALLSVYDNGNVELKSFIDKSVSYFSAVASFQSNQTRSVSTTTATTTPKTTNTDSSKETSGDNPPSKRKATEKLDEEPKNKSKQPEEKLKVCRHCKKEFDPEAKRRGGFIHCKSHPGVLKINSNSSAWRGAGFPVPLNLFSMSSTLDTAEWRMNLPDGFKWDCCLQIGPSEGCESRYYHEATLEANE
ncbi:hypothetical protein B0T20DRAFT_494884 [Sordaria brevicollis]|uniref:Uncharacterized protein n=1 Tax=Sordaria brevicollis TaxID=83679 RepID=A0AAE0PIT4_SORBR|nr:hypothetical protein B0T20DRAFT_494884 [Sordaria brevicollis]